MGEREVPTVVSEGEMNYLYQLVASAVYALTPDRLKQRQGERRNSERRGGRRESDKFPPLTGEEIKARLEEIG